MKIHNDALMPLICAHSAFIHFREELDAKNKILEAENRLASVAPAKFSFVDALRHVGWKIAETRVEPARETYMQICNEAAELLCAGVGQAEVLWYFDMMLYNALHPDRRTKKEGGD